MNLTVALIHCKQPGLSEAVLSARTFVRVNLCEQANLTPRIAGKHGDYWCGQQHSSVPGRVPLVIAGQPVQIAIVPISAQTIRISIVPLEHGNPGSIPNDGALVQQNWPPARAAANFSTAGTRALRNQLITIARDP